MLPETERIVPNAAFNFCKVHATLLKGVCYSHFGIGAIYIAQRGFLDDQYKVNLEGKPHWPIGKNPGLVY